MQEIWKDVKGYEGYYKVSNLGNVLSLGRIDTYLRNGVITHRSRKEKLLKPKLRKKDGYFEVHLRADNKEEHLRVHRLVANAFICNEHNKPTVNHINGIKTDNNVVNLEWNTISENTKHATDLGLNNPPCLKKYVKRGADHSQSKLSEKQVLEIRVLRKQGYKLQQLASMYNVSFTLIHKICKRQAWKYLSDEE